MDISGGVFIAGYDGRYTVFPDGTILRNQTKWRRQVISIRPKDDRYLRVTLTNGVETHTISVHRIVAQHFVPNPNNLPCVNHKDGNKHNNNASNLEWVSVRENTQHAIYVLGATSNSEKQRNSARAVCALKRKLTMQQANEIRSLSCCVARKELANKYDVSLSVINTIINRKTYRD